MVSKKAEEQINEDIKIGFEARSVESASTEDYTIWTIEKMWVNIEFRVGTNDYKTGFNVVPPANKEVQVAFALSPMIEIPEGVISFDTFQMQYMKLADAALAFQSKTISDIHTANNTDKNKGF